jgi:hypothetical protein
MNLHENLRSSRDNPACPASDKGAPESPGKAAQSFSMVAPIRSFFALGSYQVREDVSPDYRNEYKCR